MEIDEYDPGPFKRQINLFMAMWSQFCYVGAQVSVANYFVNFCEEAGRSASTSSDIFATAQGLYAFNRFLAGRLMTFPSIKPRFILAIYLFMSFMWVLIAAVSRGTTSIAMLCLVLCFESACFATIFTLGLRGLGRHTKLGGSFLVAAISGGAAWPPMTGAVATHLLNTGDKYPFHKAIFIPMTGFICAWVYPLYVNIFNRDTLGIRCVTAVGIETTGNEKSLALETTESRVENKEVPTTVDEDIA